MTWEKLSEIFSYVDIWVRTFLLKCWNEDGCNEASDPNYWNYDEFSAARDKLKYVAHEQSLRFDEIENEIEQNFALSLTRIEKSCLQFNCRYSLFSTVCLDGVDSFLINKLIDSTFPAS